MQAFDYSTYKTVRTARLLSGHFKLQMDQKRRARRGWPRRPLVVASGSLGAKHLHNSEVMCTCKTMHQLVDIGEKCALPEVNWQPLYTQAPQDDKS